MRNYFPLKTFYPDAVVARLNELYATLKCVDVDYDEESTTFEFDANVEINDDLSVGGDLVVTGSINGEENPSVKPLYWHGINLVLMDNDDVIGQINFVIINNSSEAIDTPAKFIAWYNAILSGGATEVTINANGFVNDTDNSVVCNHIYMLQIATDVGAFFVGENSNVRYTKLWMLSDFETYLANWGVYDATNKLN